MKTLRKVYALSSGEYSDYSVMGIFEDEQTAKEWAEFINTEKQRYDRAETEEMIMIPSGTKPYTVSYCRLEMDLWDDGKEGEVKSYTRTGTPISLHENPPKRPKVRKVRAPIHRDMGGRIEIIGSSEKSIRKVLGEQLNMWRAANPKSIYWGK